MKSSFYNIDFPSDDGIYIFNTLRGTVCEMTHDASELLKSGSLSRLDTECLDALQELGMIVADETD